MSEYPDSSPKGSNPKYTVNRRKPRIKSTDPRNNVMNTMQGDTFIVDDSDIIPRVIDQDFEDIATLTIEDIQGIIPQPNSLSPTGQAILPVPENVDIDSSTFRIESLESQSGDGNIYFTATLNFDDVLGAAGYEYIINASD